MFTLTITSTKGNQYVYSLIHLQNNQKVTNIDNLDPDLSTV